ncbi:serine/threonine-protein kinase [Microtetraspora malaysiensis]|uniref:serine/threonine-protein kinase n=1 Tax=Microtetraspora malaysiensis TaxID=161358 RepID=UPI00082FDA81|nr:serine/threonine-protein kinase [Microtetraspora malaysiensis]
MDIGTPVDELSEWSIGAELGRGGMGVVHAATRLDSGTTAVIKLMRPELAEAQPTAAALFRREMAASVALRHPQIVRTLAVGDSASTQFIAMELCERGSLAEVLSNDGPLSADQAVPMFLALLDGLEYAHDMGFVHRDIKPQNILLTADGTAKIADFGLAKAFEVAGWSGLTRTGTTMGTPAFMPREQVLNYKYAKPGVDVWAMAATLYYALTGRTPRDFLPGKDPWLTVCATRPVSVADRRTDMPAGLVRVLDHALDDSGGVPHAAVDDLRAGLLRAWHG